MPAHDGPPALYTERIQLSDPRTWRRKAAWTLLPSLVLIASLAASDRYRANHNRLDREPLGLTTGALIVVIVVYGSIRQFRRVADVVAVEGDTIRVRKGIRRFRVPAELVIDVTRGSEQLLGRTIQLTLSENTTRLGPAVEFLPLGFDSMLTSELLQRIEYVRRFAPRAAPAPAIVADETPSTDPHVVPVWVKVSCIPLFLLLGLVMADETFGSELLRGYARQAGAVLTLVGAVLVQRFHPTRRSLDWHHDQKVNRRRSPEQS